jgi:hypothetical protein
MTLVAWRHIFIFSRISPLTRNIMPPKKKNKPAKKVVTLAEDATEVLAKVRELRKKTAAIIEKEAKKEESADDYGDFDPR